MRFFTIFLIAMLTLQTFANDSQLKLDLGHSQVDAYKVVLGTQTHYVENHLIASGLYTGRHQLKIFTRYPRSPFGSSNRYAKIYDGFVDMPAQTIVSARLWGNGSLEITRKESISEVDVCIDEDGAYEDWHNYGEYYDDSGWETYVDYHYTMPELILKQLIARLNEEIYDRNRVELIRRKATGKQLSAEQVMLLLMTFSFDSYRFDAAKVLKPFIVDSDEIWRLEDVFTQSSYKRKVSDI
jgi:hypothetical protein